MKLKYKKFRDKAYALLLEVGPLPVHEIVRRVEHGGFRHTPTPIEVSQVFRFDDRFVKHAPVAGRGEAFGGQQWLWRAVE